LQLGRDHGEAAGWSFWVGEVPQQAAIGAEPGVEACHRRWR
jgi:hypothetical protein